MRWCKETVGNRATRLLEGLRVDPQIEETVFNSLVRLVSDQILLEQIEKGEVAVVKIGNYFAFSHKEDRVEAEHAE